MLDEMNSWLLSQISLTNSGSDKEKKRKIVCFSGKNEFIVSQCLFLLIICFINNLINLYPSHILSSSPEKPKTLTVTYFCNHSCVVIKTSL